jgi:hypothetical protein
MTALSDTWGQARRYLVAALIAGGLVIVALRGGSYDVVNRGEVFVAVWWMLCMGTLVGVLPSSMLPGSARLALIAGLALVLWTAIGLAWTESAERTIVEAGRTLGYVGLLVLVLWILGGHEWHLPVVAAAAGGVVICAVALASRLAPDVVTSTLAQAGDQRRLSHPFDYWNAVGCWSAMTIALGLALSAHAGRWWLRGLALAGVNIAVSSAYLSYSRSMLVGVAIAVVAVLALSINRWLAVVNVLLAAVAGAVTVAAIRSAPEIAQGTGAAGAGGVLVVMLASCVAVAIACLGTQRLHVDALRMSKQRARASALAAVTVLVLAGALVGPGLANRAWSSFSRTEVIVPRDPAQRLGYLGGGRRILWSVALDTFAAHPLRGTGAGTFEYVWNRDRRRSHHVRDAHSLYLESLAEIGLPGAALVLLFVAAMVVGAVRGTLAQREPSRRGAAAGCAAAVLVFAVTAGVDWMWESTAVPVLAITCAALAMAGTAPRRAYLRRGRVRVAIGLLAVGALALQLPVLVSASEVRVSQAAVRERHLDAALSAASVAVDVQPWGATGYLQRSLVLARAGQLAPAARDAMRATQREPTNWETWLVLAELRAQLGQVKPAVSAATQARRYNPNSPLFTP